MSELLNYSPSPKEYVLSRWPEVKDNPMLLAQLIELQKFNPMYKKAVKNASKRKV